MYKPELTAQEKDRLKQYALHCNHCQPESDPNDVKELYSLNEKGLVTNQGNHMTDRGMAVAIYHLGVPFSQVYKAHNGALSMRFRDELRLFKKQLEKDSDLDAYGHAKMAGYLYLDMFDEDNTFHIPNLDEQRKIMPVFFTELLNYETFDWHKTAKMMGVDLSLAPIKCKEDLLQIIQQAQSLGLG